MKKLRFGLIALAVMLSVGGAYATKPKVQTGTLYDVLSVSGSNYNVQVDDGTGSCSGTTGVCKAQSTATPVNGQIPISETNSPVSGEFSD